MEPTVPLLPCTAYSHYQDDQAASIAMVHVWHPLELCSAQPARLYVAAVLWSPTSTTLSTLHGASHFPTSPSLPRLCTQYSDMALAYQLQMSWHLTSRHTAEAISLVTRFALAREGSRSVVAEGIGVASACLAFIHICKTAPRPRDNEISFGIHSLHNNLSHWLNDMGPCFWPVNNDLEVTQY